MTVNISPRTKEEKAEDYFADVTGVFDMKSGSVPLDDFQYHSQTALSCAVKLHTLPRDFWHSEEGSLSNVLFQPSQYGKDGAIRRVTFRSIFFLQGYFEGILPEGDYSNSCRDSSEQIFRILNTYNRLHKRGIL